MIIRLTVENFLSFNHKTEILLTPGRSRSLPEHIVRGAKARDVDVLKSAIIYGANASGKTNIVHVLRFFRKLVVNGSSPSGHIDYARFKLDKEAAARNSQIELEFLYEDTSYAYGIVFNPKRIEEEWLYRFNREQDWKIYERHTTGEQVHISLGEIGLSKDNRRRLEFMAQDTLPHELFLYSSNHRNITDIEGIAPIRAAYRWFEQVLTVLYPHSRFAGVEINIKDNTELRKIYHWFLSEFQTGISGLQTVQVDFFGSEVHLPSGLKEQVAADLKSGESGIISSVDNITYSLTRKASGELEAHKLMTRHAVRGSDEYALFEINEESDGTQRIMDLIPALTELSRQPRVFVIDEIDRSLHPKLTRKLFELFFRESGEKKSQLICTTHESSLLDQDLFRKDEIWFVEKDGFGESGVYSLEEFRPRKDKDIRTGYLKGRYSAVPHFSDMEPPPWKTTS